MIVCEVYNVKAYFLNFFADLLRRVEKRIAGWLIAFAIIVS